MRVLIAHSFYRVGGGEDRYVNQLSELLRPYHEVAVLARRNDALSPDLRTAMKMAFSIEELRAVESFITRFQPDVIHLHNPYPALGPAIHLGAERQGIPLVMTIHNLRLRCPNGLMFTEGQPCRRCEAGNYVNAVLHHCFPSAAQSAGYAAALWMHRFLLRLEGKVRVFITPSDFMRRRLREWGIAPGRTETIRNFVRVADEASPHPGTFGVYVGRLSAEKGLEVLLKALCLAGDPPFRIIGDGPLEMALTAQASRLGLRRTQFLGRISPANVWKNLQDARFFAMPSLSDDNAPLAVLEAMAAGRPVLVSRMGGLAELVEQGGGVVNDPGDVEGMAGKIRALVDDDDLCRTLGAQSLAVAREQFSAERHRARLEAAYERVSCG